jgi:hypothetical protein
VKVFVMTLLMAAAVLYVSGRVWLNLSAHPYPPAACQLLGGTWGPWSGWRCY